MPPKADPYATPLHRRIDTFLWIFSLVVAAIVFIARYSLTRSGASYRFSVIWGSQINRGWQAGMPAQQSWRLKVPRRHERRLALNHIL